MINLEDNNLNYFISSPESFEIEPYMAMPEEGEDGAIKETDDTQSEDNVVEETSEDVKEEEPEVESVGDKEEKKLDESSEEVSEEINVETEDTAKAATEEPEVESVEDKEEKKLDESSEEVSEEINVETEDSHVPVEMKPEEVAHLSRQSKIIQATYGDIRKDLPQFNSGDTISVGYRVIEGNRSRVQIFEGVVIKISSGHGLDKTFTVRKISGGVGVERIFPFHSPNIESIKVLKEGKVRRAKLYYLRGLKGKATRIKDRIN